MKAYEEVIKINLQLMMSFMIRLYSALPTSDGMAKREFVNRRTKSFNESSSRVHFLH